MKKAFIVISLLISITVFSQNKGEILPFPESPTASKAEQSLQESVHKRRTQEKYLPKNAPNIVIVMLDDVGFGVPSTFGGEIQTPTLTKVYNQGIAYNRFHTTGICSPTRASLLTGRNHTNVGSGTIAERALDWDGYTGIIPKEAATFAEVLKNYGYSTSVFGKWHNTPATHTSTQGPFQYWPLNYGFEHFYGFMGGETSHWNPRLVNDFTPIEPPENPNYHLSTDLADKAIEWINQHQSYAQDKPFLLYFAPGAGHGPHHVATKWSDKYNGKFDDGWDAYRERVFLKQKQLGWIPQNTVLTPRDSTMASWASIPESEKPFQRRLMEIYAGMVEHCDYEVGRVLDEIEQLGQKDNTMVIFIWGDNGSSAEGQNGTISELLAQNQIPNTISQQLDALNKMGGLNVLGTSKTENMFHAGWGWATNTPFRYTKLVSSHFGSTRNPLVISYPKIITPEKKPREQFLHLIDIAPTIFEIVGISPPKIVNGNVQMPIDGKSFARTFEEPNADIKKNIQFFDNNGSRGIYKEGWYACTFGPLIPWISAQKGLGKWDSRNDKWELYNLDEDFSQSDNLAKKFPEKLEELKKAFLEEAEKNKDFPIGAAIYLRTHPEELIKPTYTHWDLNEYSTRMPEFTAPGLGRESNKVEFDIEIDKNTKGVVYALGGSGGGIAVYMQKNRLTYEYNMMLIENYKWTSEKLSAGKHHITITTKIEKLYAPAEVKVEIDGKNVGICLVNRTVPGIFTANETLDIGKDLGSSVSLVYHDRAPFPFTGKIKNVKIDLLKNK